MNTSNEKPAFSHLADAIQSLYRVLPDPAYHKHVSEELLPSNWNQFSAMLSAGGHPNPTGYLALKELQRSLSEKIADGFHTERMFQLTEGLSTIEEHGAWEDPGRFDNTTRNQSDIPELKEELAAAMKAAHEVKVRFHIATAFLNVFETFGGIPPSWDELTEDQKDELQKRPFQLKVEAIAKVLKQPTEPLPKNNTKLYERAAALDNLRHSDPADAFRKDLRNNFQKYYGRPVPSSPDEWKAFFKPEGTEPENRKAERKA